jgi:hypothetical protein
MDCRPGVFRLQSVTHIGKISHLTGSQSESMHFYAQEYSKALGRTITFQDMSVEPWWDGLLERGVPVHLVNHLATMADLHRTGRYDRMSDDMRTLTGQGPLSVQEFAGRMRRHAPHRPKRPERLRMPLLLHGCARNGITRRRIGGKNMANHHKKKNQRQG